MSEHDAAPAIGDAVPGTGDDLLAVATRLHDVLNTARFHALELGYHHEPAWDWVGREVHRAFLKSFPAFVENPGRYLLRQVIELADQVAPLVENLAKRLPRAGDRVALFEARDAARALRFAFEQLAAADREGMCRVARFASHAAAFAERVERPLRRIGDLTQEIEAGTDSKPPTAQMPFDAQDVPCGTVAEFAALLDSLCEAIHGDWTSPGAVGGPARTEVVLWEGAEHNERNVRLARTRSAYLEAHGNVAEALAALKADGNEIARRTFYNHLDALDTAIPHWRDSVQLCNQPAQMHGTRIVGTRGKSRGKAG
jgi:HAMP domain-containing protein